MQYLLDFFNNVRDKIVYSEILPLNDNKYYHTEIKIVLINGEDFTIPIKSSYFDRPSDRFLNNYGYTVNQWEKNEIIGNDVPMNIRSMFEQNHTESQFDYNLAYYIQKSILISQTNY